MLTIKDLPESLVPKKKFDLRKQDCICLLSGGMDSLVGAIDLHEEGRNPLFVSQIVRGDADHQREYAMRLDLIIYASGVIRCIKKGNRKFNQSKIN